VAALAGSPSASSVSASLRISAILAGARHACGELVDERVDLALRHRAHKAVGGLAVDEGDHGGDRLDTHLARDRRMLVDVHLDQFYPALGGADGLFQDRRQLAAGAAPWRPEVDQHRLAFGFLDDVLHEGLRRRFFDEIRRCLRGRSAALFDDGHVDPRLDVLLPVSSTALNGAGNAIFNRGNGL
jgi:hypothetical protein